MKNHTFLLLATTLAVMLFHNSGYAQQAPTIINQPQNQVVVNGTYAYLNFQVQATGTSPLHYQWQFDGTNLTQFGGNSPYLSGELVNTNYAGNYDVVITNAYGSITSAVVALIIAYPPTVTNQPVSLTVSNGGTASFSVGVAGTGPFSYQWLQNGVIITNNIITTLAGKGAQTFSGDGGAATNASLDQPSGLAMDGTGNLYIADKYNNRIRKVNSSGIISTVAGDSSFGYNGNSIIATNTSLADPSGVAVDAGNELFIADTSSSRVRFVVYDDLVTLAGNGSQLFFGDGGPAYNAQLNQPTGVAVDASHNVYIVDANNDRVRKVDVNDIITTVAGNGSYSYSGDGGPATNASLYLPSDAPAVSLVAVDASGNLFIADSGNNRVRKVATNGIITTVAGRNGSGYFGDGGAATNALLNRPSGLAFDALGNLLIADTYNGRVRKVNSAGIISTMAGNGNNGFFGDGGTATNATFDYPTGLAVDASGSLYIADCFNNRIRKVTTVGAVLTLSNITVTNAGNYQVIVTSAYGSITSSIAVLTVPAPPVILRQPAGLSAANGTNATFSVVVTGAAPLAYQWQFNGTNLTRQTNSTLTLNAITATNAGPYQVVVTNLYGSVTSSVATLTVTFPPVFLNQLQNTTIGENANIRFTLNVTGGQPLFFQWYYNNQPLAGQNTNSLFLSSVTALNNGSYYLVATNVYGRATSSVMTFTVAGPPVMTTQPVGGPVIAGTTFALSGTAAGTSPFQYQWQFNGTNLPGPETITTVAGNGSVGYSGDGGPATQATLRIPYGTATDGHGDLFIADSQNNRVREVDTNGIITTVAGNGTLGYTGDGGSATNASIGVVTVAVDGGGNLYLADQGDNVIRKVDTNGIITTVAGNGNMGYAGDGGPATNATLNFASGVSVDNQGNVFIADQRNSVIRKVDPNGIITTVAGNGQVGYAGDGGTATSATLNDPFNVTADNQGRLFIAEQNNNVVRMVDTNGIITTVAGNGTGGYGGDGGAATNASLHNPAGVALDARGDLYIADSGNQRVRMVNPGGLITTVAGNGSTGYGGDGGAPTSAVLDAPSGVMVDPQGNLYITDTYNDAIREVAPSSGAQTLTLTGVTTNNAGDYQVIITDVYGSVTSSVAAISVGLPPVITSQPLGQNITNDANASFNVAAAGTAPLAYQWQLNGANLTDGGVLDGSATTNLVLTQATAANSGAYAVSITNAWGSVTSSVALLTVLGPPAITGQPSAGAAIAGGNLSLQPSVAGIGPLSFQWQFDGTNLPGPEIITTVAGDGSQGFAGDGGPATNANLSIPYGVAVDQFGDLFIGDSQNNRVRKVDTNGIITTVAGNGTLGYSGDGGSATNASIGVVIVAVDSFGNLYLADQQDNVVRRVDPKGIITTLAGNGNQGYTGDGGPATNATLNFSSGVSVDNQGNVFIADQHNSVIRKVDTNGIITTVAGNGKVGYAGDGGAATNATLNDPFSVTADNQGRLFIAEQNNQVIRMVDTNGIITTVAGNGTGAFAGDGGAATNASLHGPSAVALDGQGNLYIADSSNQRVREVNASGIISTYAGTGAAGYGGNGGSPVNALLEAPSYVAVNSLGNLFITDCYNDAIREVAPAIAAPALALPGLSPGNSGVYQLIVSNAFGSVTSSVVNLTVSLPLISAAMNIQGGLTLNLLTGPNVSSRLLAATNLVPPVVWLPVGTNIPGNSGAWLYTDTNTSRFPMRFYRTTTP